MLLKTDWQKNIKAFLITSIFQWFYIPIGVWVFIWREFLSWPQIGTIIASGLVVSLILELPSGALADMWGRKKTVLLGRFLGILGFGLYSIADNFYLFLIANILYHANWAFESGALSALLFDSLKENDKEKEHYQKTEENSFFWATIGMAGASILGGYLFKIGVHFPYVVSTFVAIAAFISAFWLEEPKLDSKKYSLKDYLKQNWDGMIHIFHEPLIRSISLFSISIDFVAYVGLWYLYEPRLAEGNFPPQMMGWLVAGTYLIRAFGTKIIPFIMRFGDTKIPILLTLLQVVGSGLSFIGGKFGAISSVYSRKFSDGIRKPILARLQNEQIESKYRATSLSAISLFSDLAIALVGTLVGWMIETYSASTTLGISAFVGIIIVLPLAIQVAKNIKQS